jgi:hypothetical protein
MKRTYYSSRKHAMELTPLEFHDRVMSLFNFFRDKDYFKQKTGPTHNTFPDSLRHEAAIFLGFRPFPLQKWLLSDMTEENLFDVIEFLYDRVSKPGEMIEQTSSSGWNYSDYDRYDEAAGQMEYKEAANAILNDWHTGYELGPEGNVQSLGEGGLQHILGADILPFDEVNVDAKVSLAISKWKSRRRTIDDMKESVRLMADVFEFLKKSKDLGSALDADDASLIFNIANNFAIRHHNPKQKSNYDSFIWYSWMFHFYLATYHASIRVIYKKDPTIATKGMP